MVDSFAQTWCLDRVRNAKMRARPAEHAQGQGQRGHRDRDERLRQYGSRARGMKAGAYDYVQKPFKPDEIVLALRKAEERELLRRENRALRDEIRKEHRFEDILAKSQKMQDIFRTISKIAEYKTTVLVAGESGVGKELVARAIHHRSSRRGGRSSPSTAARSQRISWKVSSSVTKRARSPTPCTIGRGLFEEADGAPCSWTRSASCPWPCRSSCAVLEDEKIRRVGDTRDLKWTCASSPRRTAI